MRGIKKLLFLLLLPLVGRTQPAIARQHVTVNGKKMTYTGFNLGTRRPGAPVLVFEAGMGLSGSVDFRILYPGLEKFAAGLGYDRNGEGGSDEDTTLTTDADLARRLHEFLRASKIAPPYILVGHSMGGPYIRMFTALYPAEVAGLIFIDSPDFMLTDEQDRQIRINSGSGKGSNDWVAPYEQSLADDTLRSLRSRHRFRRLASLFRNGPYREYKDLPPLPDIPVAVLASYNKVRDSTRFSSADYSRFEWAGRIGRENFLQLIKDNHDSFFMLLPGYPHGIHGRDPELVDEVIERIYRKALQQSGRSHGN
ncbi:MAG: alpha/beta fold hydrolase [Bacteroidetes bacterium]|nr:alpha/beta fold hydrolase [Bacteroidota bacterium]